MHIDRANLNNLTQLWQHYGSQLLYNDDQLRLNENISWPNRVWADMTTPVSISNLKQVVNTAPSTALFPLWPTITKDGSAATQAAVDALVHQSPDWQLAMQHTAMALELNKQQLINTHTTTRYPIHIKRLRDNSDIAAWVATGSKAFNYTIDVNVITPLLAREDTQILLAYNEHFQPVATGLLLKTDDVVGIHQIGVPAEYQGKGYATQMMHFLIQCAKKWQADYAVLQASKSGRPVYQKLGFVDQFLITYLQRYKS